MESCAVSESCAVGILCCRNLVLCMSRCSAHTTSGAVGILCCRNLVLCRSRCSAHTTSCVHAYIHAYYNYMHTCMAHAQLVWRELGSFALGLPACCALRLAWMVRFIVEALLTDETSLEVSGTYTVERRDKQTNRLVARMTVNGKGEAVKKNDALVLCFMKDKLTVPQTSLDVAGNSWAIMRPFGHMLCFSHCMQCAAGFECAKHDDSSVPPGDGWLTAVDSVDSVDDVNFAWRSIPLTITTMSDSQSSAASKVEAPGEGFESGSKGRSVRLKKEERTKVAEERMKVEVPLAKKNVERMKVEEERMEVEVPLAKKSGVMVRLKKEERQVIAKESRLTDAGGPPEPALAAVYRRLTIPSHGPPEKSRGTGSGSGSEPPKPSSKKSRGTSSGSGTTAKAAAPGIPPAVKGPKPPGVPPPPELVRASRLSIRSSVPPLKPPAPVAAPATPPVVPPPPPAVPPAAKLLQNQQQNQASHRGGGWFNKAQQLCVMIATKPNHPDTRATALDWYAGQDNIDVEPEQ